MSARYLCFFLWYGKQQMVAGKELADFKDGFWVNSNYQLTKGSDCIYWIPPSQIVYVQKQQDE